MRRLFCFCVLLLLVACSTTENNASAVTADGWSLVFENDDTGSVVAGSKAALIEAVRAGKPIRVYTAGRRIEHASEAVFLSVFGGEVFAQLPTIESQRPLLDPLGITFRSAGQKWRSIVGSNGFVAALMDGSEPRVRSGGARWFVQN